MIKKFEQYNKFNDLGKFNSDLLLFDKNKDFLSELKLWLEYNGLRGYSFIYDTIKTINNELNILPTKIKKLNTSLCAVQYDVNNRIELVFNKNGDMTCYKIHLEWDGKKMHHNLIKNITTNNINEIIKFFQK